MIGKNIVILDLEDYNELKEIQTNYIHLKESISYDFFHMEEVEISKKQLKKFLNIKDEIEIQIID